MEKRPKIYIETTVPNYVFNDDLPEKQTVAKQLFSLIHHQLFNPFVSPITIGEINKSPEPKRSRMLEIIQKFPILEPTPQAVRLTEEYIRHHIIPGDFYNDGLHIAIATVNHLDIIVSYNFQHIVNLKTIKGVTGINLLYNLSTPEIVSPEEVIYGTTSKDFGSSN